MLDVMAHTYRNSGSRESSGDCCDRIIFCVGQCDNQFIFCLRHSFTSNDGNPSNCPLGSFSTGEIGDDSFTFSSPIAAGVPNPMTFTGSVWPVSKLVHIANECAWHYATYIHTKEGGLTKNNYCKMINLSNPNHAWCIRFYLHIIM